MTIKTEKNLRYFDFWSGAAYNAEQLSYDELDELEGILEGIEEEWDAAEINDLLWFDFPVVCEWLGLEFDEDSGEVVRDQNGNTN